MYGLRRVRCGNYVVLTLHFPLYIVLPLDAYTLVVGCPSGDSLANRSLDLIQVQCFDATWIIDLTQLLWELREITGLARLHWGCSRLKS